MIKKKTKKGNIVTYTKFCDKCNTEIKISGSISNRVKCEMCESDLCEDCIDYEEGNTGDYREVYCKDCWMVGKLFREEINKLEVEIDNLYENWRSRCKK